MNIRPIVKLLVNRPKTVILVFTILTIVIGSQATKIYMESDLTSYLPTDDPNIKLFRQIYDEFQIGTTIIIVVEANDIRNIEVLKEMNDVESNIDKFNDQGVKDGVFSVKSLAYSIMDAAGTTEIPDDENLIYTYMTLPTIEKTKGILFSNDYTLGVIIIQLANGVNYDKMLEITKDAIDSRGTRYSKMSITGGIAIQSAIRDQTFYYLEIILPIAIVLVTVYLLLFHRTVKGLFIGFLPLIFAITLTFGVLGIVSPKITILSIAIVALLLGLGIDYSIYLTNRYAEEHAIKDKVERVEKTLGKTGKAVFLCAFTTIVAFGSLMTSNMPPMVTFGFGCAIGISFAFISAFILVPCLCIILKFEKHEESRRWKRFAKIIINYRKRFFVLAIFFGVLSLIVIPQIKTDVNYFAMAPEGVEELDTLYKYSAKFGGGTNFNAIRIETESQGLTHPEVIDAMLNIEEQIRETGASAYSIADEIKEFNEILNQSIIIQKLAEIIQLQKIIFDKIAENGLVDQDYSKTLIVVAFPANRTIQELEVLVNKIDLIASNSNIPYNGKLSALVGQDVITVEVNRQIASSQISSLIVALLLVLACLIIGFNSSVIGFIALIPVLFVLAWEPGALVLTNIPLSVINITVASIMIGTGIDYSIQTTQRVREEVENGMPKIDAIKKSIETSGFSIIGAAGTTIIALTSTFLVPISLLHQFSILVITLIIFSFMASISIIPTILSSRFVK